MGDSKQPKQYNTPRRRRVFTFLRIGGTVAILVYVFVGVGIGLVQQNPDLPADDVQCEYRVTLIRDRLVSHMDRSTQAPPRDPEADAKFFNLYKSFER